MLHRTAGGRGARCPGRICPTERSDLCRDPCSRKGRRGRRGFELRRPGGTKSCSDRPVQADQFEKTRHQPGPLSPRHPEQDFHPLSVIVAHCFVGQWSDRSGVRYRGRFAAARSCQKLCCPTHLRVKPDCQRATALQ